MRTIYEKGHYIMFKEIRSIINAADSVMQNLSYFKENAESELERLNAIEDPDEWDNARKIEYAAQLDAYNEVQKALMKWVKNQL